MEPAPALLVIANAWDVAAGDFVARHAEGGMALLVPRDLSRAGWHFRLSDPAATTVVADGRQFRLDQVGGVLMRLAAVSTSDLPHIAAHDRIYVAAELTAFLLAVLTRDDVLVLNRPTPQCLCGPAWHDTKWRHAAGRIGLPVHMTRLGTGIGLAPEEPVAAVSTVTVVGDTCIGGPQLEGAARAVARMAGAEMLTAEFDGTSPSAALLRAHPHVDLGNPLVAEAVLRRFGLESRMRA